MMLWSTGPRVLDSLHENGRKSEHVLCIAETKYNEFVSRVPHCDWDISNRHKFNTIFIGSSK